RMFCAKETRVNGVAKKMARNRFLAWLIDSHFADDGFVPFHRRVQFFRVELDRAASLCTPIYGLGLASGCGYNAKSNTVVVNWRKTHSQKLANRCFTQEILHFRKPE
ncbi:hypothetical protein Ciccas_009322, partial [Cichlidogyrus casuarinus]